MSARASVLKRPTAGTSPAGANQLFHTLPPTKLAPLERATIAWLPFMPWVKVTRSARPSALKSASMGVSPSGAKYSCHLVLAAKPVPVESMTWTSPVPSAEKRTASARPSPLTSATRPMSSLSVAPKGLTITLPLKS